VDGRHELKFYINPSDYAQARARLRAVAKPDGYAFADGCYTVRSLYFDNYADKAIVEKLSGLSRREKYRLRYYNYDASFIRLERKSKANRLAYKEEAMITDELCSALLAGDHSRLKQPDAPLLMELYSKTRSQMLRPRNIVDYRREAFIYRSGNVRVTFDSGIRTSNNAAGFLDPKLVTIPVTNTIVMEIKYDGFLPDIIRDLIKINNRNQTEFSKYVAARLV